jgi:hypothetical protein
MKRFPWLIVLAIALMASIPDDKTQAQPAPIPQPLPTQALFQIQRGVEYVARIRTFDSDNEAEIRVHLERIPNWTNPRVLHPDSTSNTILWVRAPFYVDQSSNTKTVIKNYHLMLSQLLPGDYRLLVGIRWFNNDMQHFDFELFQVPSFYAQPADRDAPIYAVSTWPTTSDQAKANTGSMPPGGSANWNNWHFLPAFTFKIQ